MNTIKSQESGQETINQIAPLTWLRAIAAFLVLVSHSIRAAEVKYFPGDNEPSLLILSLFDLGYFGVCLFLALSGSTLTLSAHGRMMGLSSIPSFYFKRFMRIWPAFAISLTVYLIFILIFNRAYAGDQREWVKDFVNTYEIKDVLRYLTLTYNVTGPSNLFNMAYWTLPIEFQYYLILPFSLLLMNGLRTTLLTPLVFGGTLWAIDHWVTIPFDRTEVFRLAYIFWGGVLMAALSKIFSFKGNSKYGLTLFLFSFSFLALDESNLLPKEIHHLGLGDWGHYGFTALICVGIALYFEPHPIPSWARDSLDKLGEISYSIYLYHILCINCAVIIINTYGYSNPNQKLVYIIIISFALSYIMGALGYRWVEKPSISLARKWLDKDMHNPP